MRPVLALALCLGLAAMAYAQDAQPPQPLEKVALEPPTQVLLKGLIADEDMFKDADGTANALHGHWRHWHHNGPRHDPHDHPYWERRHNAKAELLRCLHYAVDRFEIDDPTTWKHAGKLIARCFLEHLGHCHDVPELGDDITKTLPWIMAVNGLDALVEAGSGGLLHAKAVFDFYLAGAVPKLPNGQDNPWYTGPGPGVSPPGCASKLISLLQSGCHKASQQTIWALASVVAKLIENIYTNPSSVEASLGNCAPDIPAVILALFSTGCPASSQLWNPLVLPTGAPYGTCTPPTADQKYQNSAAAQLGGSIYTLLLLSGKPQLVQIGIQIAFAANRIALAATQTGGFSTCIDSTGDLSNGIDYKGELAGTLARVPDYSGVVLGVGQAYTPLSLGPDGQRVVCAAIGMMSGSSNPVDWQRTLLWQAAADISNAISATIIAHSAVVPAGSPQRALLCAVAKALWSFTNDKNPTAAGSVDVTHGSAPLGPSDNDFSCITTDVGCLDNTALPSWLRAGPLFGQRLFSLADDTNNLGTTSATAQVCGWTS